MTIMTPVKPQLSKFHLADKSCQVGFNVISLFIQQRVSGLSYLNEQLILKQQSRLTYLWFSQNWQIK
jgi:hypothetical protein